MKLILTRHGETIENQEGILQGHMPGALSDLGKMQAKRLGLFLKDMKIDAIFTSDLDRAADTAKEIHRYHEGIPLVLTKELREGDMGSYTGKSKKEVDFNNKPSDMESWEEMRERTKKFLTDTYDRFPDGCVLFVGHNGINKALISVIMNKNVDEIKTIKSQVNTAVNIFEIKENGDHRIHLLNSSKHLDYKYPSRKDCLGFYREQETPENIIKHVVKVNKVAVFLAKKLLEAGEKINLKMVDKASLLHDLDKWRSLKDKSIIHGELTEKILAEKGYPELGYYAKRHILEFMPGNASWEEKVIMYSDKRVMYEKVVSLKKRFDYINEKYPAKDIEKRQKAIRHTYDIEKEIMDKIAIDPEKLSEFVEASKKE